MGWQQSNEAKSFLSMCMYAFGMKPSSPSLPAARSVMAMWRASGIDARSRELFVLSRRKRVI